MEPRVGWGGQQKASALVQGQGGVVQDGMVVRMKKENGVGLLGWLGALRQKWGGQSTEQH